MDKKPGTDMDKSGRKKKLTGFHSGKRLRAAKELRSKTNDELATAFECETNTVQKWMDKRGIPKKRIRAVANFFKVEKRIFSDDYVITEAEFEKLFNSDTPEPLPLSRKSRLALFPVHFFRQGISAGMTDKKDGSAGENATTQDGLLPDEHVDVPMDWDRVISSSQDEAEYHFWVGSRCNEEGKYDQALFNLDKAIQANTLMNHLMCLAYYERGYSRYKNGDLQNAFQDYLKSLQTELDNPFQDLGFKWYNKRGGPERIKEFTQLLKAFPDRAVIYYLRGLVSLDLGDYDTAVADFNQAIGLEPESGNIEDFRALRGYALYHKGLYQNTLDDLNHLTHKGIVLRPEILFYRALCHEKTNQIDAAICDIKECLHADPDCQGFLEKFSELQTLKKSKKEN